MKEFDSEFCHVKCIEEDDVVLLTWKSLHVVMIIENQPPLLGNF